MRKDDQGAGEMLTVEQGKALLGLARGVIARRLGVLADEAGEESEGMLQSEALQGRRGTFVTLKKNGELRGCIGSLAASESIVEGVRRNALNAAFHDSRFHPLGSDELSEIEIEVSILTEPARLSHTGPDDLLAQLRVGVDGVILRKGLSSATFLPQVWEQLPDKVEFLDHLCRKAWLPRDAWRREGLEVYVYQVQHFEE